MVKQVQVHWMIFLFLFVSLAACGGTRVVVEGEGERESRHGYHRGGGPPPWAPAHGYRAKHKYRYYPDARVYYDTGRKVYFYWRDGKWRVSVSLPASIRLSVGDYVTLEMDSERPYHYHDEVVKRYPPGQLKKKHKKKGKGKWK
jgi:hypothetical protein